MKWTDHETYVEVHPPKEFNFEECLLFLGRSDQEVLHRIREGAVYKLLKINESFVLCRVSFFNGSIHVAFLNGMPSTQNREIIAAYVWEWFDLDQDLVEFYLMANQDQVLKGLVQHYYGLRMMCIPDLFEVLAWAIMGQQINLTFAYTLKKRFVERYGESFHFEGETYWVFPTCERIAKLDVDELRALQFTKRKAEYICDSAKSMVAGEFSKRSFLSYRDPGQIQKSLMSIRGVGAWTADYVRMKCFHDRTAFPIADVGLHHALQNALDLDRKPTTQEVEHYRTAWDGWQAYATFYLWRSLYDNNETI